MITDITPEQMAEASVLRSDWRRQALSLEPLNRPMAEDILHRAYQLAGYPRPSLFFFDSVRHAITHLGWPPTRQPLGLAANLASPIVKEVRTQFAPLLWTRIWRRQGRLYARETERLATAWVTVPLTQMMEEQVRLPEPMQWALETHGSMVSDGALLDFCITVLGCTHAYPDQWQTVKALMQSCFWHLAFEDICVVVDPVALEND